MEGKRSQLECDELEILLGEIPIATSGIGNPPPCESVSLEKLDSSVCVSHQTGIFNGKPGNVNLKNHIVEQKNHFSPSKNSAVELEEPNYLPDDQSLTSALTDLSFHNGEIVEPFAITSTKMGDDGLYIGSLKEPVSSNDSKLVLVNDFELKRVDQPSSNAFTLKVEELNRCHVDRYPSFKTFSGALPPSQGVNSSYLSLSAPVPGAELEFPVMTAQHHYIVDPQSHLYSQSEQFRQPEVTWRYLEKDRYERIYQHYQYLQQLRYPQLQAYYAAQANGNITRPFSEMSISQDPLEQSHQIPYWKKASIPRSLNQTHRIYPSSYFGRNQVVDKAVQQNFPEKILTRSQGVNSLRPIKLSSSEDHENPIYVNQNGRAFTNGRLLSLSNRVAIDSLDLKHDILRTQLQKNSSFQEWSERLHLIAKDQHGCRFLQRKLAEGSHDDVIKTFDGIIGHIVDLMTDPFGNYLVQKLLEVCNEAQQMQILMAMTKKPGELVRISCDMHGTRAVQKVIETLKTPEQCSIVVSSLKPGIVALIKNMNGNHVAQRCLQYLMPEFKEFLFEAATLNCIDLATDRHGCCVLQKCLSYSDGEHRHRLIHEITSNALLLSQDPFGNYVVQFVFDLRIPWATADLLGQLENNYCDLSVQKYSSNVVEKCLKYSGEECRSRIIQELINSCRLDQIMLDPYGNYVIQAALSHSKGAINASLVEAIRPHIPVLRTSPYGKQVLLSNCLKK